jgi:flagellar basal-body rod modification protein FlgD
MTTSVQNNNTVPSNLLDLMNGAQSNRSAAEEAQDRFMTLLVTQMKNQDPLNPMDNAQMTSQLAQLSTVTGIDKLNDTMQALIGNVQSSQTFQAAGMIGREVYAPGNIMQLNDGPAKFGADLPMDVDRLDVTIRDADGNTVRTLKLGARDAGLQPLEWDGLDDAGNRVKEGLYNFEITASVDGSEVSAGPLSQGVVDSVANSGNGVTIHLKDLGSIALSEIRQVL